MNSKSSTQQRLDVFEKNTVDIAVIGLLGVGKSSLVNALRGLSNFEDHALTESASQPMCYPHPTFLDVIIWELPGFGTPNFKADEYLEGVNYSQYDFFIVISSNGFTDYDLQLSLAIQKKKKRFYYVWSKMDIIIKYEKLRPDFNEESTLQKVRKYCLSNLAEAGISSPHLFLISSCYQDKFDFPLLQRTLENDTNELRKCFLRPGVLQDSEKRSHDRSTERSTSTGICAFLSKTALAKMKEAVAQKCLKEICRQLDALENASLNIAITGSTGTDKSSFINALRGMTDDEKGAAKTGLMQTTMDIHGYHHPLFPNVTLWDLPGTEAPEFEPNGYLDKVNLGKYDIFILVSSQQFTVNDARLAGEIQKREKKLYYVCFEKDVSMALEVMDPDFNLDKTIEKKRDYCCEDLIKAGEPSPRVFLVSRRDLNMYDFPLLQEALENDLNDPKKHTFIASLPVFSREILKKKKAAMERLVWQVTAVSCHNGKIPAPGLSVVCDLNLLVDTMKLFYKVFGLDEDSLCRVAKLVGKNYEALKSAIKKSPMSSEITPEFVYSIFSKSGLCFSVMVIQAVLNFIPVLGLLVDGASSFISTLHVLMSFLRDMVEDAENVRAKAAEP